MFSSKLSRGSGVPYLFWKVPCPDVSKKASRASLTNSTFNKSVAPKKLVMRATEFLWAENLYSFFTITSIVQLSKVLEAGPKNQL